MNLLTGFLCSVLQNFIFSGLKIEIYCLLFYWKGFFVADFKLGDGSVCCLPFACRTTVGFIIQIYWCFLGWLLCFCLGRQYRFNKFLAAVISFSCFFKRTKPFEFIVIFIIIKILVELNINFEVVFVESLLLVYKILLEFI